MRKKPSKEKRKYYDRNRNEQITERLLGYKIRRGLKCEICGYSKNWSALIWHHNDPDIKEIGISSYARMRRNWTRVEEEIKKCKLICHNCHSELHYPHASTGEIEASKFSYYTWKGDIANE